VRIACRIVAKDVTAPAIEPLRRIYDLRHTFATLCAPCRHLHLRPLPRSMGANLTMIHRHHGHLARDSREHAIRLLDQLSTGKRPRWTLVDVAWTPEPAFAASAGNESAS
jgi:hypothetical protein